MCLKLVKNLPNILQLPINHGIMKTLAKNENNPSLMMFRDKPKEVLQESEVLNLRSM